MHLTTMIPRRRPVDWLILALATGLFAGTLPLRTATIGTLWGIPLAFGLFSLVGWWGYLPMLLLLWGCGVPLCSRASQLLGQADPREITYDEFTTLPLVYFLTPHWDWRLVLAGFILHRFFDILKPMGIRRIERLPGGIGIMADDVLAALLAFAVLQLLIYAGFLS